MIFFFFFVVVALFLVICQTIILPGVFWFPQSFDLLIILVIYLSLAYSNYWVVLSLVLLGGIMDSLSGVPFFLHIFSYFWVYMIVQLLKQFVFQRNLVFMMVISLISVAIHQGLILFSIFVSNGQEGVLTLDFSLMLRQLIWGVLFIPPGIWGMNLMRQNFVYFARQIRRELERKYRG